ncbi:MAG TPA: hypothetical protein VFB59_02310 [Candidatus Saccharimonadales bacterium]|nr:hypothetical protein [Candidatus Saccharimonadales bacterium]
MTKQTLDFTSFHQPIALRDMFHTLQEMGKQPQKTQHPVKRIFGWLYVGVSVLVLVLFLISLLITSSFETFLVYSLLFAGLPILALVLVIIVLFKNVARTIRVRRLAQANGFSFSFTSSTASRPGLVFGIGSDPRYTTVVGGTHNGLPFEFGNFQCTVGSGRNRRQRGFGIIEVHLTRKLPHILLDGRKNNAWGFGNLAYFKDDQQLTLEGNFNEYFELYVPNGYERDALYFITPELMALLIDFGANFDIEIIDDRLYIYKQHLFELQKQQTIEDIFRLIDVLGAEVQENTKRYADANVGDRSANAVAGPGQRLKKPAVWLAIVAFVFLMILIYALTAVVALT